RAFPSRRQESRQHDGDAALLEMPRQQRESDQQQQQVDQSDPLMMQMVDQAACAGDGREASEEQLVPDDHAEANKRYSERVMVEYGDPSQRGAKQHKIDWDAEYGRWCC